MNCLSGQRELVRGTDWRRSAGFSMVEILLAAMILSVGFIMLLPAFIVGLAESRRSVESSIVVQLGQNAEAFCHALLDTRAASGGAPLDPNFTAANPPHLDGNLHNYQFNASPPSLANRALPGFTTWRPRDNWLDVKTIRPNDDGEPFTWAGNEYESRYERSNVRIYGDPFSSKYYWSLLYRFPRGQRGDRSQVELWIMICRRDKIGDDPSQADGNMIGGLRYPTRLSVSGSAGDTTLNTSEADFLETGSGVVTNRGEILHIASRLSSNTVGLREAVQMDFDGVYVVKFRADASERNACISVVHTTVGH